MSTATLTPPPLTLSDGTLPYRLSVAKYEELGRLGVLGPEDKVELIDGILVAKMTIGTPHTYATTKLSFLLRDVCGRTHTVFTQQPVALTRSMPEPDVSVANGVIEAYLAAKPSAADTPLVVEVAESTLAFDLGSKARVYAEAGVPEYWVVDLVEKVVHVHTDPQPGGYAAVAVVPQTGVLSVTLGGQVVGTLAVKEFLP